MGIFKRLDKCSLRRSPAITGLIGVIIGARSEVPKYYVKEKKPGTQKNRCIRYWGSLFRVASV